MVSSLQEHTSPDRSGDGRRVAIADVGPRPRTRHRCRMTTPIARLHQAEELVNLAAGRREPLEQLRSDYLRLLHGASDDLAATEALRVVEAALRLIPRPAGIYAWQRRWSIPNRSNGVG